jgi:(4S)-4-hydroxy-5-phosphonooxypentane-2,3-dione isomerase
MIATCVHIKIIPGKEKEFIAATSENRSHSIKEPGNLRFDFLQDPYDANTFMLYEAYESEAAAAAHKDTAHYAKWRDTVADWMAIPRNGVRYNILEPINKSEC